MRAAADKQGNFNGIPAYREKFGVYVNEEVGYQLTPAWQSGLGQCSGIGSILSIFATAWFQQRYGYRKVILSGLVAMFAFIFNLFVAQNVVSIPWLFGRWTELTLRSCLLSATTYVAGPGEHSRRP